MRRRLVVSLLSSRGSSRLLTTSARDIRTYTRRELLNILGTSPDDIGSKTLAELYKSRAMEKHPDRSGGTAEEFQLLTAAKERLEEIGLHPKSESKERAGGVEGDGGLGANKEDDATLAATAAIHSYCTRKAYAQAFEYLEEVAVSGEKESLDGNSFEFGAVACREYCAATGGGMELAVALLVTIVDRAVESGTLAKEEHQAAMDNILFEVKESGDVDAALKLIKLYDERGLQPKVSRHN